MPETPRELSLSPMHRATLRRLRDALGITAPPELDVRDLAEVETFVGSVIPDLLIALVLAQGKTIGVVSTTTAMHRDFGSTWEPPVPRSKREQLICFDHWGEHPLFTVGFVRTQNRADAPELVVWDHKKWVEAERYDVARYVEDRYVRYPEPEERALVLDLEAPPGPADEAFTPRLLANVPKERWVEHPKFGRGKLLREADGRLEIAFVDATRTLLAKFVRDV